MSRCRLSCGRSSRGCCGHDHGSKAVQKPSLVDIEVVRNIFSQAMKNMFSRALSCARGELSKEDLIDKDEYLSQWLTETFCGHNKYFEEGPECWNPTGLAEVLRQMPLVRIKQEVDDEAVVFTAISVFIDESHKIIANQLTQEDLSEDNKLNLEGIERFIEYWTLLFSGAPSSILGFE